MSHAFVPIAKPGWTDVCGATNPDWGLEDETDPNSGPAMCGWPLSDH